MYTDPIVEEVRRIREEYAKQFNYDAHAIAEDLRKQEKQHSAHRVSFPPKRPRKRKTA